MGFGFLDLMRSLKRKEGPGNPVQVEKKRLPGGIKSGFKTTGIYYFRIRSEGKSGFNFHKLHRNSETVKEHRMAEPARIFLRLRRMRKMSVRT